MPRTTAPVGEQYLKLGLVKNECRACGTLLGWRKPEIPEQLCQGCGWTEKFRVVNERMKGEKQCQAI